MNLDLDRLAQEAVVSPPTTERTLRELRDRVARRQRRRRIAAATLLAAPVVLLMAFAAWSNLDPLGGDDPVLVRPPESTPTTPTIGPDEELLTPTTKVPSAAAESLPPGREDDSGAPPVGSELVGVYGHWDAVDASVDGRWVTIELTGAEAFDPDDPCSRAYMAVVVDRPDAVTVLIEEWRPVGAQTATCATLGVPRQVRFELDEPLGSRPLRKGAT